jgi:hypothetical protein
MSHILLKNAFVFKKRSYINIPPEFNYDKKLGAWISKDGKVELVNHKGFPGGGSKKCDIETGEDQKGQ